MRQSAQVAFVIPCFNEEISIAGVVQQCRQAIPEAQIFVFDNNSTDQTEKEAKAAGAVVVRSPLQGKGEVIRHAFMTLEDDVLIILDGDGTYDASLAPKMVEAIVADGFDMVVCNRVSSDPLKSYPRLHVFGNRVFSFLVSVLANRKVGDVFSGYRAVSRGYVDTCLVESKGFEIESEMTLKALSHGLRVKEIEGLYGHREQGSHSKLRTFSDGTRILKFIFLLMRDSRPLLFFGSASVVFLLLSILAGIAPVSDYITYKYVHTVPRAILAASLMVLSMMFFAVGLILDAQVRHLREQSQLMRRWIKQLGGRNAASFPPPSERSSKQSFSDAA